MTTISSLLVDCLKRFNNLVDSQVLQQYASEVPEDLWQDELGRLRVWAANIGAHQVGQSSLDYRLRDASNVKEQAIRLLKGLQRAFDDLDEVIQEQSQENVTDEDDSDLDDMYGTEIQQIYKGAVNTIDCLFQMSMVIRRPAPHDRLAGTRKADAAVFEPYDRQHVENKYPRANRQVIDRLGMAISRRRADLKYRERHHAKMGKGLSTALHDQPETASTTILSETIATDFENEQQHIQFDDTASEAGLSQTSYAQTLIQSSDKISIPPPPKDSLGEKPFECPYCFYIITARDRRAWARHVFTDIMPYVCIFPDCSTPFTLYTSRREWYHHLHTSHSIPSKGEADFDCPLCQENLPQGARPERHIGRHLEELALFAIPRTGEKEDDDHDDFEDNSKGRSASDVSEGAQSDHSDHQFDDVPGDDTVSKPASEESNDEIEDEKVQEAVKQKLVELGHNPEEVDAMFTQKNFTIKVGTADSDNPQGQRTTGETEAGESRQRMTGELDTTQEEEVNDVLARERKDSDIQLGEAFTKINREYLLPDTLRAFRLPWEWDHSDQNYIVVKQSAPEGQPSSEILKYDAGRSSASSHEENRDTWDNSASEADSTTAQPLSPNRHQNSTENEQLDSLRRYLRTKLAPLVDQYISQPPTDPNVRELEHKRIGEMILAKIILKTDTLRSDDVRIARRALVKEAQEMLNRLDAVPLPGSYNPTLAPNRESAGDHPSPSERSEYPLEFGRLENEPSHSRWATAELNQSSDSPTQQPLEEQPKISNANHDNKYQSSGMRLISNLTLDAQKRHTCKVCHKRFRLPSSLQTHMYSHTAEEPFACDFEGCGRHFSIRANLLRHQKTHKGEREADDNGDEESETAPLATEAPTETDVQESGQDTAVDTDDQKEEDIEQRSWKEVSLKELGAIAKVPNIIPPGARWTKIDRRLVNPAALEMFNERFEEREDHVVVLRVLTKDEIQALAAKTEEIRDARHKAVQEERRRVHEERRGRSRVREEGRRSLNEEYEDDSSFTMTIGFTQEQVPGRRIYVRPDDNGGIGLNIEGRRPKKYIMPYVPDVTIAGSKNEIEDGQRAFRTRDLEEATKRRNTCNMQQI